MAKLGKTVGLVLGSLAGALAGAAGLADLRWRSKSRRLVGRLRAGQTVDDAVFSSSELDRLPDPVARYLRTVLPEGRRLVAFARFSQSGEFLLKPEKAGWSPFRAEEHVATRPAGFVWDARIRIAAGISIRVRDSFVQGEGAMVGGVFGLVPVVAVEGTPEIAEAALQRYLAEAVWIPTALLPSCGVAWTAIDASRARATLSTSGTTASIDFHFGEDGLVEGIFTEARARLLGGRAIPTPWQGRFRDYAERGGMRIPLAGEVEWVTAEGPEPYWRGRITKIEYDP